MPANPSRAEADPGRAHRSVHRVSTILVERKFSCRRHQDGNRQSGCRVRIREGRIEATSAAIAPHNLDDGSGELPACFHVPGRVRMNTNMVGSVRCPVCGGKTAWGSNPWRPFCSERCHLTDLGAWAAEWYRLPGPSLTTPGALDEPDDSSEQSSLQ